MTLAAGDTSARSSLLITGLQNWALGQGAWKVFDNSSGFRLSDGSVLSPEQHRAFPPLCPDLAPMQVSALGNSGAVHLCIPEHLAIQLRLAELERHEVVLADGQCRTVPYVGPVKGVSGIAAASPMRWCWVMKSCWARSRWKTWIWCYASTLSVAK
jgi:hypothetical protein